MELHEEDLSLLLCHYPIAVKHVSRMGPNRYRIDGPFDLYELVVLKKASGHMRAFVSDYAAMHGFWRPQRFIHSLYGEPFIDVGNGHVAGLMDWFNGNPCTPSGEDLADVAQTLAKLHNALCGAREAILNTKPTEFTQRNVPEKFLQRMNELNHAPLDNSLIKGKSLFSKWLEEAKLRANWLWPIIQNSAFRAERSLYWNVTAFRQFVRFSSGQVGILQSLDPEVCTALLDLSVLVFEACANSGEKSVQAILNAYGEIAPLETSDINFILASSAFPKAVPNYFSQEIPPPESEEKRETVQQGFATEAQIAHRLMRMIHFP